MIDRLDRKIPAGLLHADTITCLRNSGAQCSKRRDNAVLASLDRTEAGPGAGNEAAVIVDAANEPSTRTKHLCRVREAHRVSSRRAAGQIPIASYFQRVDTMRGGRVLQSHMGIFHERITSNAYRVPREFPILRL